MAPGKPREREPSIERSDEYEKFLGEVEEYYAKRGTKFEREPKITGVNRRLDLFRLYNEVISRGGYDVLSREKLAWRNLGLELFRGSSNLPALAFSLKSAYYKNLAAYEISTYHHKEPPPREIFEDITAKGGDLLTRTVDNFTARARADSEGGSDQDTPAADGPMSDGPESAGRAPVKDSPAGGRNLRQAPPQRILFQPDLTPARQPRIPKESSMSSSQAMYDQSSSAGLNAPAYNLSSFNVQNYQPRPAVALTLRQVSTPSNNPEAFKHRMKAADEAKAKQSSDGGYLRPGTGFRGPNIYVRCLMGLRSGLPDEQANALHHLVKISHERGDKFKFETFPGLAEGLIEYLLKVGSLFYEIEWEISYLDDGPVSDRNLLDGVNGTPDLLERIQNLTRKPNIGLIETLEFSQELTKIHEAGLILRNMALLEENAKYLAAMHPVRDYICIALNLPRHHSIVELRHHALDVAEQITKYLVLETDDPLYRSLVSQVETMDRGIIITSLRAICRISMNCEESNRLGKIPMSVITKINDWTLLDDDELVTASLDFLYQFTAIYENVEAMLAELDVAGLINHLTRLLLLDARVDELSKEVISLVKRRPPKDIPDMPTSLIEKILAFDKEADRSSHWLRACFEEDPDEEILQIQLWQAYQGRFVPWQSKFPMLNAADFIRNVSATFSNAAAQVLYPGTPSQKFIIRGICPRSHPMGPNGETYVKCLWRNTQNHSEKQLCGKFWQTRGEMYRHVLVDHLQAPLKQDGTVDFSASHRPSFACEWNKCDSKWPTLSQIAYHLRPHMSAKESIEDWKTNPNLQEPEYRTILKMETATDDRGDAAGIPLTSALVLRNLARNLPKARGWMPKLFLPVCGMLHEVLAHNQVLAAYVADLLAIISTNLGGFARR